jgi:hypothetical protein
MKNSLLGASFLCNKYSGKRIFLGVGLVSGSQKKQARGWKLIARS